MDLNGLLAEWRGGPAGGPATARARAANRIFYGGLIRQTRGGAPLMVERIGVRRGSRLQPLPTRARSRTHIHTHTHARARSHSFHTEGARSGERQNVSDRWRTFPGSTASRVCWHCCSRLSWSTWRLCSKRWLLSRRGRAGWCGPLGWSMPLGARPLRHPVMWGAASW